MRWYIKRTIQHVLSHWTPGISPRIMPVEYRTLTEEQRQHFLDHGWIRIEGAVPKEDIARFTQDVWVRLGYDPNDKSTWIKEKV